MPGRGQGSARSEHPKGESSSITVTWRVPSDVAAGRYRLRYQGDSRATNGRISAFTGTTEAFDISPKR